MKRLILATLAMVALAGAPLAWGANSATLKDTIDYRVCGAGPVYEYQVVIDTVDTALDIRTPSSGAGNRIWLVGALFNEATATNITLQSISTTPTTNKSIVIEDTTFQGMQKPVGKGFIFVTNPNEKLTLLSSAAMGSVTLYVVEAKKLACGQ